MLRMKENGISHINIVAVFFLDFSENNANNLQKKVERDKMNISATVQKTENKKECQLLEYDICRKRVTII